MTVLRFDGWKLDLSFAAAHCIPYHQKCERLHGHHYALHLEVEGEVDANGFVIDFSPTKRALREIAGTLDHRVLVPTVQGRVTHEVDEEKGVVVMQAAGKRYVFPREDCAFVPVPTTTAEHIASYVLGLVLERIPMPPNVHSFRVGVDEGYGQGAWQEWKRKA